MLKARFTCGATFVGSVSLQFDLESHQYIANTLKSPTVVNIFLRFARPSCRMQNVFLVWE